MTVKKNSMHNISKKHPWLFSVYNHTVCVCDIAWHKWEDDENKILKNGRQIALNLSFHISTLYI